MMKRLIAVILFVILLVSVAQAGTFASYRLPDGAQVCSYTEAAGLEAPEELKAMYALMSRVSAPSNVYLIRMPNGRALVSVGCSPVSKGYSADELLAFWPQIALALGRETAYVNDAPECASIQNRYGFDGLHIQTTLAVGEDSVLYLEAEGFAFCRGNEMLEVWAVWPKEPVYLYSEEASAGLEADLAALDSFLQSLDFSKDAVLMESVSYTDPDGLFAMQVLTDSVIITPETPMEEVSATRERFAAANEEGAAHAFDQLMKSVYEEQVTMMLTADMKGAIQVFCSKEPDYAGVTAEMLHALAEPIRQSLQERYGLAVALGTGDHTTISGQAHAFLGYWLRSGEFDMQLDVMGCVIGEDWLCEVDIFTVDGDQTLRSMLHSLMQQTLRYTVE